MFCNIIFLVLLSFAGYGFVDFESPASAEGAVKALIANNVQAQMAKVGIWYHPRRQATVRLHASNT